LFDVFWHVLRGPLVGTRWTQFGNISAAFGVAGAIAWVMTQLNVSDILAGTNINAARTALAIGHGSLEMGNYFGVDSLTAPAPQSLW
jgi:stage V sporulation protein SpoVS